MRLSSSQIFALYKNSIFDCSSNLRQNVPLMRFIMSSFLSIYIFRSNDVTQASLLGHYLNRLSIVSTECKMRMTPRHRLMRFFDERARREKIYLFIISPSAPRSSTTAPSRLCTVRRTMDGFSTLPNTAVYCSAVYAGRLLSFFFFVTWCAVVVVCCCSRLFIR